MGTLLLHHPSSTCLILNRSICNCITNCDKLLRRNFVTRGVRFDPEEELGGDLGDRFGFREREKTRTWWSDYDENDDFGDWEEDEDGEFWIFKLLRAFGWMLPVVGISLLLGTGPNTFLMALAVPLAQSVLSLVIDKAWDRKSNSLRFRPKTKTRKRPFAKAAAASNVRTSKPKQEENVNGGGFGSYETGSWFGGWDDLDRLRETPNVKKSPSSQKENELPKQQSRRKLSRVGRVREKPLFLRLLVATFPFLGNWTRLLF